MFSIERFGIKRDGNGYYFPNVLQEVQLNYVTNADCNAAWSTSGNSIVPSMMCATNTGKDVCAGDEGGPLFDATENVLVGIVSNYYYCDGSVPVIFSRIANQWVWIQTTICANHSIPKPELCLQAKPTKPPKPVTNPIATPVSNPARPPMKPKKPAHKKKGGQGGNKGGNGGKMGKLL